MMILLIIFTYEIMKQVGSNIFYVIVHNTKELIFYFVYDLQNLSYQLHQNRSNNSIL